MGLLDGGLAAVFGAAFAGVFRDGVLHKAGETDTGAGGFAVTVTDHPCKVCLDALQARDRAASGLPATALKVTVLRAGLSVPVDIDDSLTLGGATYRVVQVGTDPAGAAYMLAAVPA